jgi:hypothetical protein
LAAIVVCKDEGPGCRGEEEVERSLGLLALVVGLDGGLGPRNQGFGEDQNRRDNDVVLVLGKLVQGKAGRVLPGVKYVTDAVLGKDSGGIARLSRIGT